MEDRRGGKEKRESFHYEGGIRHYVEFLNEVTSYSFDPPICGGEYKGITVEVSLRYTDDYSTC